MVKPRVPVAHTRAEGTLARERGKRATHVSSPEFLPKRGLGKRPSHTLWPVGSQGPLWQPLTAEEIEWKKIATGALKRGGGSIARNFSNPCLRRPTPRNICGIDRRHLENEIPLDKASDVDVCDSISQVPTFPGTPEPRSERSSWDVLSAETATASCSFASRGRRSSVDIDAHLGRNRAGWYDWHAGRLLG